MATRVSTTEHYRHRGFEWSIRGQEFVHRTVIELRISGPYAKCLRDHPEIRLEAMRLLLIELQKEVPVATGMLYASIRLENRGRSPTVTLGPEPYNRSALLALQAGRVYRPRKRKPKLARHYARPANVRSGRPGYIYKAIDTVSELIWQICVKLDNIESDLDVARRRTTGRTTIGLRGARGTSGIRRRA